jgi:prepilin peptidase CpaA
MFYLLIVAAVVAAVAAWTDGRTGHIPNWLTLGALGVGIVAGAVLAGREGGWRESLFGVGSSLAGAALCGLGPALLYWKGAMGGGDVKLFVALGALLHPLAGLEAETYALVAAAIIAPAQLAYRGVLLRSLGGSLALLANPLRKKEERREVPAEMMTWFRMGPAIFVGAGATLLLHWNVR